MRAYFDLFKSGMAEGKPGILFPSVALCFSCELGGEASAGHGVRQGWGRFAAAELPGRLPAAAAPGAPGPPAGGRADGCRQPAAAPLPAGRAATARRGSRPLSPSPKHCLLPADGLYSSLVRAVHWDGHRRTMCRKQERRLSVPVPSVVIPGTEKHVQAWCRGFSGRKAQVGWGSPSS